jgi:hypothetical protein
MEMLLVWDVCGADISFIPTSHHMVELIQLLAYVVPEGIFHHRAAAFAQFQT